MTDFESMLQHFYTKVLTPGATVVDVGAHFGRHTLPLAERCGQSGHVFAFEPLPFMREQLFTAIQAAQFENRVTIYEYALSDAPHTANFIVAEDAPSYSGLKTRRYDRPMRTSTIQVEVRRLDEVITQAVDYIKIDVEGGDYFVLLGATNVIDIYRPIVSFEFSPNAAPEYKVSGDMMWEYWGIRDYKLFDLFETQLDYNAFKETYLTERVWDYLAVPSEKIAKTFVRRMI